MTELDITIQDNYYKVRFCNLILEFSAGSKANEKALILFLRSFKKDETSKTCLFSLQQIADVLPGFEGASRQSVHKYEQNFRESNEDLKKFLNQKRKVDEEVVNAVKSEVIKDPLFKSCEELAETVNRRMERDDINEMNIRAALSEISYLEIRPNLKNQFEKGQIHYKEEALLAEMKEHLPSSEKLQRTNFKEVGSEGMRLSDPTAIKNLITPGVPTSAINTSVKLVVLCMMLWHWGVPLSKLGEWVGVHKTTVLRWMLSLSAALWVYIYDWRRTKIQPYAVYVDEKWLKIKKRWHYWFVVVDESSGIPILTSLQPSRGKAVCEWLGVKLQSLGQVPKVIITDGLAGYLHMIPAAKHILCIFHHQQTVTRWLKEHFVADEDIKERKSLMKGVFQTKDKRTVLARLKRLQKRASELKILDWIEQTIEKLPRLLPAVGSRKIPNTSNTVERFFRAFSRYYKTRAGFTSVASAKKNLIFFLVMYLFIRQAESAQAPIEKIIPEAKDMPLYKLVNDPL
jgi:transposase-like protein